TAGPLAAVGRGIRRLVAPRDERAAPGAQDPRGPGRSRRSAEDDGPVDVAPRMGPIAADTEPAVIADAKQIRLPMTTRGNGYRLPPPELLRRAPVPAADERDAEHTMAALERTFRNFGVPARVVASHRGPTV